LKPPRDVPRSRTQAVSFPSNVPIRSLATFEPVAFGILDERL
jgi:hypothetical protein